MNKNWMQHEQEGAFFWGEEHIGFGVIACGFIISLYHCIQQLRTNTGY
jgi:hypothetical protein